MTFPMSASNPPPDAAGQQPTRVRYGVILFSITLAYALLEIPGGWMGDWLASKIACIAWLPPVCWEPSAAR